MKHFGVRIASFALALALFSAQHSQAQVNLLATGTLDQSRAGSFADLSGLNYSLENGAPANLLGGFGSAIAYASGNTFLALPDRGPNAISFNSQPRRYRQLHQPFPYHHHGPGSQQDGHRPAVYADSHTARHHPALEPGRRWFTEVAPASASAPVFLVSTISSSTSSPDVPTTSIPTRTPAILPTPASIPKASASPTTAAAFSSPTSTAPTSTSSIASPACVFARSNCPPISS